MQEKGCRVNGEEFGGRGRCVGVGQVHKVVTFEVA